MAGLWPAPGLARRPGGGTAGAGPGAGRAPPVWPCARPCALAGAVSKRFHGACVGRPAALDSAGWGTLPPHSPRAADRPGRCAPSPGPSAARTPPGGTPARNARGPCRRGRRAQGAGRARDASGHGSPSGATPWRSMGRMAEYRRRPFRPNSPRERSSGGLNTSDGRGCTPAPTPKGARTAWVRRATERPSPGYDGTSLARVWGCHVTMGAPRHRGGAPARCGGAPARSNERNLSFR